MENKDYYTLKEIVFGLRSEYIKVNKKLNDLKQYISIDNTKTINSNFKLDDKKRLFFEYKIKRNIIQKALINFFDLEKYYAENICDKYDFNKHDFIKNNSAIYKITDKDNLYDEINKILNIDIINNTNYKNQLLEINSILTRYYNQKHSQIVEYNSLNDNIKIFSSKLIKSEDIMKMFIDTKLNKHSLPDYCRNIIDNSNISNKQLVIYNNIKNDKKINLNIEDQGKQIILKKMK